MVDIHLQVKMYGEEGDTIWGRLGRIIHGGYPWTDKSVRGEGDTLSVIG